MPGGGAWVRRGEWLEAMPGRAVTSAADKEAAADRWLLETAGMPEKLHARLRREGGIRLQGDRLRLALFPAREAGIEPAWDGAGAEVLYEDDFVLVMHKPSGMAVHPDGSGTATTLDHVVAAHYAAAGGGIAVRHIHRLDKDTTGPVLYAKNEYAQLVLDEDLRQKAVSRQYAAIVAGTVPASLTVIDAPIGRDRHHAARRRVSPGGQPAVTRITGREPLAQGTVVTAMLETGRTHQIRVHLSHAGHPLYGDKLYGGPAWVTSVAERQWGSTGLAPENASPGAVPARQGARGAAAGSAAKPQHEAATPAKAGERQALHGELLVFRHPWTRRPVEVADPWPEDMLRLKGILSAK